MLGAQSVDAQKLLVCDAFAVEGHSVGLGHWALARRVCVRPAPPNRAHPAHRTRDRRKTLAELCLGCFGGGKCLRELLHQLLLCMNLLLLRLQLLRLMHVLCLLGLLMLGVLLHRLLRCLLRLLRL